MRIKNIICLALAAVLIIVCAMLSSCGNHSMGFGEYEWTHIHYSTFGGESGCATVNTWYDSETGVEVITDEIGTVFFSEGTYIMFDSSSKCPFCNNGGK